ncbi:hypothetical protein BHM03_00031717, partial [Ensete ventricosum]
REGRRERESDHWFSSFGNVLFPRRAAAASITATVEEGRRRGRTNHGFVSSKTFLSSHPPGDLSSSWDSDDEYEKFIRRMNPPRYMISCNVVSAEVWTHNSRAAAVMQVTDEETGSAITDPEKLSRIKELLCNVLKGNNRSRGAKTMVSMGVTQTERRLHQMMFDDRDYERSDEDSRNEHHRPKVTVVNWFDKDYSVVTIRCKDRPKLLFDTVCTLTDMQYVVFHGNVDAEGPEAYQYHYCSYFVCAINGFQGLKLELCTSDRMGLLTDVTRIFRENGLTVTRAEVATRSGKAINTFYVRDAAGNPVDPKTLDDIRAEIGQTVLQVKGHADQLKSPQGSPTRFLFGGLFKSRSLCNLGLIRPYT